MWSRKPPSGEASGPGRTTTPEGRREAAEGHRVGPRQADPQRQPALGLGPGPVGQAGRERLHQYRAPFAAGLSTSGRDVVEPIEHARADRLRDEARGVVRDDLAGDESIDDRSATPRTQPTRSPPQASLLSEPTVMTRSPGSKAAIGGGLSTPRVRSGVRSSTIWKPDSRGQPRQLASARFRHHRAGRVLEGRDDVRRAGPGRSARAGR